jgi:shikimate dehydrogenase
LNSEPIREFGLIGYPLSHSRSVEYFAGKFRNQGNVKDQYHLFPLKDLSEFPAFLIRHPNLHGLNVTLPYKEKIIPFLDSLDETAREIGAVNTIRVERYGNTLKTIGFNTDAEGFRLSVDFSGFKKAFVLGTGGASKAVSYALKKLNIPYTLVSRNPVKNFSIGYTDLGLIDFTRPLLVVNATPMGMFPDIHSFPPFPFGKLSTGDLLYDLVYNPPLSVFLAKGAENGAFIRNGMKMLEIQAGKSWEIWTSPV